MGMTATCPGCGAPLPVTGGTNKITCTFCGTNFNVDMSQAQPKLNRQQYVPPESQPAQPKAEDFYGSAQQPQAGDPYGATPQPQAPQPYSDSQRTGWRESVQSQLPPQWGNRVATWGKRALWTGAIVTFLILGASCLCMVAVIKWIFGI